MVFNYIFFPVGATSSSCSFCLQQNPFSLHIYLLPGTQLQYWKVCVFVERLLALVSHFCQELLCARVVQKRKIPLLFIRIPCLPLQVLPRCSILRQPEISSLRDEHHLLNDMKKSLINHKDKAKKMFKECFKIIIFLINLSD